jgi:hypothetical protein
VHLVHEEGIGGQLEGLLAVRLQPEQRQVALHLALGHAGLLGHRSNRPTRAALGLAVQHLVEQTRHTRVIDCARPAGLRRIGESRHAVRDKALAPVRDRVMLAPQTLGDCRIRQTIGRPQHHLCPPHQAVGQRPRARQPLQLRPLPFAQNHKVLLRSSCAHGPSSLDRGWPHLITGQPFWSTISGTPH